MVNKLKAIMTIMFGNYAIIRRNGISIIVHTDLTQEQQKKAACLFFREAHSLPSTMN